ncbi:hypothetical protein F5Y16DRAFT_372537 [Xylariaceae sp. FL0255]|nr:hypothetical protein F5Y16DRAFT_372537 [Xylariaceae sp. FL0255]
MPATVRQYGRAMASSKVKSQGASASNISSFTRVSKTVTDTGMKKDLTPQKTNIKLEAITPASRKRKVIATIEDDSSADESAASPTTPRAAPNSAQQKQQQQQQQPVKRGRGRPPKKARPEPTPRKRVRSPSVSDSEASAIDTGALFKKLRLESSPSRCSSPLTADTSLAGSDIEVDAKPKINSGELPDELLSLIDLFGAFLKTLTLHYAHNGSNVPVDLRVLCPNIARTWAKKRVTNADIRICLGVLGGSSTPSAMLENHSPFALSNYGRGKVCVEIDQSRSFGPLNESKLHTIFRTNLTALWSHSNNTSALAEFKAGLPKAQVTLCESVTKASSIQLKGQQRLEDLKHGIAIKKQEKQAGTVATPSTHNTSTTAAEEQPKKMSLLDRIRMKSLQKQSAQLTGLTPAQAARRAALHRVEETSALLAMLGRATGESRISFAMPALLEKLKDSFRMGISRDEGAACVRLLAAEVAPDWVRVVTLGGGRGEMVVLDTGFEIGKGEVARRVADILARN